MNLIACLVSSSLVFPITNLYLIKHYYFGNKICQVDVYAKTFELYNCGFDKCRLTTCQLNYLEQFYKNKGYQLKYRGI